MTAALPPRALPPDDTQRELLHNEVHARPPARIRVPALVVYVAVLNEGISREDEWNHLRRLPGQAELPLAALSGHFVRLRFASHTLKWERHTEFTRYSIVQSLPEGALVSASEEELMQQLVVDPAWLASIPGRTVAAIMMAMVHGDADDPVAMRQLGRHWFEGHDTLASLLGIKRSCAMADFRLRDSGFERLLVVSSANTSELRVGRISQRLLDQLIALAARVERATATHLYRFTATQAYYQLVQQRIEQLRETPIPGTQSVGEFVLKRVSPAMATVHAGAQRLSSLSQRIERASALLRTRVDIATESQNQMLLEKLTRGQELQLRLQSTVEGLSIAAISYYVVSLILYAGKAGKQAGLPIQPELVAGATVPFVLAAIWWGTRQLHKRLRDDGH